MPGQAEQPARLTGRTGPTVACRPRGYSTPVEGHRAPEACKSRCNALNCRATFSFFPSFSFPPHIPTDINVSWRVRLEAPPRGGRFFAPILYGEFQKSTAGLQTGPPARTRIPHFATREVSLRRVRGRLLQAGGVPGAAGGRGQVRPVG